MAAVAPPGPAPTTIASRRIAAAIAVITSATRSLFAFHKAAISLLAVPVPRVEGDRFSLGFEEIVHIDEICIRYFICHA